MSKKPENDKVYCETCEPCVPCEPCDDSVKKTRSFVKTVGEDPRFQQQNQTLRCYVSYRDFYRCENILGKDQDACSWFKDVFQEFCPLSWIEKWDEQRANNLYPSGHSKRDRKFV